MPRKITWIWLVILAQNPRVKAETDPRKAPEIPPMTHAGIPLRVPSQVQCAVGDEVLTEGTYLTKRQDELILDRLLMLDTYGARCQARLDAITKMCAAEVRGAYEVSYADCGTKLVTQEVEIQSGWQWWHVALVGVGSLAVGLTLGLGSGYILGVSNGK